MSRRFPIRFGTALVLAALASFAICDKIKPFKVVQGHPGLKINTASFFPQINPRKDKKLVERAENPHFAIPVGPKNSLPIGQQNPTLNRGVLKAKFPGMSFTGWYPPDCDIAAGPNDIVAVVNSSIAFYKKDGAVTFEQEQETFFTGVNTGNFIFDPKVAYDPISKRFIVVTLNLDDPTVVSKILIAVSDDSDPSGNWNLYSVNAKLTIDGNAYWLDYPGLGFNKDSVVLTGNMFPFAAGGFGGVSLITLNKAPLLTGAAPTLNYFRLPDSFTLQVARIADPTQTTIYGTASRTTSSAEIAGITGLPAAPVVTTTTIAIPSYNYFAQYAESTGNQGLDAISDRFFNASWRDGSLVMAHSVDPGAGPNNGLCVARWYEVSTNGWPDSAVQPTLVQSGEVAGAAGQYTFMPAININDAGDIGMVFTKSSASITSDLIFVGRKKTDPPGVMGISKLVSKSKGADYILGRWGDYFGVDIDPSDGVGFWVYGMTSGSDSFSDCWATAFAKYQISAAGGGSGDVKIRPGGIVQTQGGTTSGGLASVLNSDNAFYAVNSVSVPRLGHVAGYETNYSIPTAPGFISSLTLNLEGIAAVNVTCSVFLYDWGQAKYVYVGAFPLTGLEETKAFKMSASSWATYINPVGQLKMVTRALMPNSLYRTAFPFTFKTDEIYLTTN